MSTILPIFSVVILASLFVAGFFFPGSRRFITTAILGLIAAFCIFGFFAAGEVSGSEGQRFRIGYAVAGLVACTGSVFCLFKPSSQR